MAYSERAMDEAIAWHLGLDEAGADEWQAFVAWLEADPAHAEAYDRLTLADGEAAEAIALLPQPAAPEPARSTPLRATPPVRTAPRAWLRRSGWGGGMVAAAAAAWLALLPLTAPHPAAGDTYSVATRAGGHRLLALADGSRIAMNGDSLVTLDRRNPRFAALDRGEAMFTIVHHADHPFEVKVDGMTLRDVGTAFNVRRGAGSFEVAVAEGKVIFQPDREAVPLPAGMALTLRDGARVELRRIAAANVGDWRKGRLEYRNVPLGDVVGDVARSTGARVRILGNLAAQPFTGTLRIDRSPEAVVRSLASLIDADLRQDGPIWVISPKSASVS